jgi:hypothetical protein
MIDAAAGPRPSPGMRRGLIPHPDFPAPRIAISVEAARTVEGDFVLHYVVTGETDRIRIPEPVRYASRHENLWHHTCFEAFVVVVDDGSYFEFNLAPSTGWDAYRFRRYRDRDIHLSFPAPHFDVERGNGCFEMTVVLDVTETPELAENVDWRLGLTVVVEAADGTKSYWALVHPHGPPDFHNADCFIAHLPAPDRA